MHGTGVGGVKRVLSIVPAVVGLGFVVVLVARQWDETRRALADAQPGWLLAGVALAGAGIVWVAVGWARILGADDRSRFVAAFFAGEIGKYVPGGIWPIVGRAEHAVRLGIPRRTAYRSVLVSLVAVYAAAGAAVGVMGAALMDRRLGIAAAVVVSLVAVLPVVRHVTWYLPAWALIAGATWCTARAVDPGAPVGRVAFAALVSWIVGFVAGPVPAGVGVREGVFVALCGLPAGVGAAAALLARLAFVSVDSVGAVLASVRRPVPTTPATAPPR